MGFEILNVETKRRASVTYRKAMKKAPPCLMIALTAELAKEAGLSPGLKMSVLLGTGEDAGRLRLRADEDGDADPKGIRSGALIVRVGYVPRFGSTGHERVYVDSRVVSQGEVEIFLPEWAAQCVANVPAVREQAIEAEIVEDDEAMDVKVLPNGVIFFRGKETKTADADAMKVVSVLAAAAPDYVDRTKLLLRVWGGRGMKMNTILSSMLRPLNNVLARVGLEIREQRDVGLALVVK